MSAKEGVIGLPEPPAPFLSLMPQNSPCFRFHFNFQVHWRRSFPLPPHSEVMSEGAQKSLVAVFSASSHSIAFRTGFQEEKLCCSVRTPERWPRVPTG